MGTAERPIVAVPSCGRIEVLRHIPTLCQHELALHITEQVEARRVDGHVRYFHGDARADGFGTANLGKAKVLLRELAHLVLFLNLHVVDAHRPHLG